MTGSYVTSNISITEVNVPNLYAETIAGTYSSLSQSGIENGQFDCSGHCPFDGGATIYTLTEYLAEAHATDAMQTTIEGLGSTVNHAIKTSDNNVFVFIWTKLFNCIFNCNT